MDPLNVTWIEGESLELLNLRIAYALLKRNLWHRGATAKALNISDRTLGYWIQRMRLHEWYIKNNNKPFQGGRCH